MTNSGHSGNFYISLLGCLLAGALLVGAFAPLQWVPLSFICIAYLFYCCRNISAARAFWFGLAFGFGQFCVGVSWVYVSLHTYGGMPLWMGSIAVLLFALVLGSFAGFTTCLAARLFADEYRVRVLALAFLWVVFEWLKSWIFTGFPWLELGYTQTPSWLFAFAPLGGVYLVSLMVTLVASCLVLLIQGHYRIASAATIVAIFFTAWQFDKVSWSEAVGPSINVAVVQPNVPIDRKWQGQYRDQVISRLQSLSNNVEFQAGTERGSINLLVWPETALPVYFQQTNPAFWRDLVSPETVLLTGIVDSPSEDQSYNAAVLNCAGEQQIYRKRHLVPFGEYLPMRFMFNWLLAYLNLPMSDFSSWNQQQQLSCGDNVVIGLSICYEDAFASEMRQYAGAATILVNISEDAWFGDSLAPHQRLQMAQMRARELARPLVRSANTGPSVVIDPLGVVLARTPQFEAATLSFRLQPQTGETPYKRFGNWAIGICMLVILLAAGVARFFRNNRAARSKA